MIRLAFDTTPLRTGHRRRGMGLYCRNLLEKFKNIDDLKVEEFTNINNIQKADLVHYPYFDLFFQTLPLNKKFPTVVTIGDVTPLIFPDSYPPGVKGKIKGYLQKLSLKSAKAIITFSESSKKDIIKFLEVERDKIFPIYLAAGRHFSKISDEKPLARISAKYRLPKQFALYVGSVNFNKNLPNLAQACINAGIDLVLVGGDFLTRDNLDHPELKSFKVFLNRFAKSPGVRILGFVQDEDLVGIYNLAAMTLLPSLYEGFGLPILESQSCGTPVVTSNVSSLPEVAGKAALFVDPNSVSDITGAIKELVTDGRLRSRLARSGFENIKRFSWEKTASDTVRVYERVLNRTLR